MENSSHLRLNFYKTSPSNRQTFLTNIIEWIEERLTIYKILKIADLTRNHSLYSENWCNTIITKIKEYKLQNYEILLNTNQMEHLEELSKAYEADNIAHFILRAAYSNTKSLRQFFEETEIKIFNLKLRLLNVNDVIEIVEKYDKRLIRKVSEKEMELFKDSLNLSFDNDGNDSNENVVYYKTKFIDLAAPLIMTRNYLFKNGFLYIPSTKLKYWLLEKFKYDLKNQLIFYSKVLKGAQDHELHDIIKEIELVEPNSQELVRVDNPISLNDIDSLAHVHYPLCMRHIHQVLRDKHHLRHFCRMQYGLFLKGLGLTLQQSLEFWSNEFQKRITEKEFSKRYSYLFKHQYGTVGGKIDYSPYSCQHIIEENAKPMEHHGCPFKHWENEKLINELKECGVHQETDIEDIVTYKKNECYTQACTKFFKHKTGHYPTGNIITSPNQFFNNSYRLLNECRNNDSDESDEESDNSLVSSE